jgi:hypothetical protein
MLSPCLTKYRAVKSYPYVIKHHAMKTCGGVKVQLHALLTSALDGGEWSASSSGRFTAGQEPRCTLDRRLRGP